MSPSAEYPSLAANAIPIHETDLLTRYEQVMVSPGMQNARRILGHPLAVSALLAGTSVITGLAARHGMDDPFQAMATDRITDIGRVNTGPDKVSDVNAEALSNLALYGAIGYLGAGKLIGNKLQRKERRAGVAELPKKWTDHVVVVDPARLSFDTLAALLPSRRMALLHDGRLLQGDVLEGGQLMSSSRRHVNAWGAEHLSDVDVLKRLNLGQAAHVVINMWQPDSALFGNSSKDDQGVSPEKIANMLRTIRGIEGHEGLEVDIVAPDGSAIDFYLGKRELKDYFVQEDFKALRVLSPESAVIGHLTDRLEGRTIGVVSHVDQELEKALFTAGAQVVDKDDADVVVTYLPDDDKTNEAAAEVVNKNPSALVASLIERSTNYGEAERAGAVPVLIPEIVAQHVIEQWGDLRRSQ